MFHIVFNSDDNYIKYTAVLITSIVKNTDINKKFKDFFEEKNTSKELQKYDKVNYNTLSNDEQEEGYVFHILTDNISLSNKKKLCKLEKELGSFYPCVIKIHILDDVMFRDSNLPKWKEKYQAHYRIYIEDVLPKTLKTCLYLDVDMLVFGDIRELWSLELKNKIAAVVSILNENDKQFWRLKSTNSDNMDIILSPNHFNSGFMLINLMQWRAESIKNSFIKLTQQYKNQSLANEPYLNAVITDNKRIMLPLNYNFYVGLDHVKRFFAISPFVDEKIENEKYIPFTRLDYENAYNNPKVIHYIPTLKPWEYDIYSFAYHERVHFYFVSWWLIALKTYGFENDFFILKMKFLHNKINYIAQEIHKYVSKANKKPTTISCQINAISRVKNHLSYKLGQAMIECSKSLLGKIAMPYVLLRIAIKHKKYLQIYKELCNLNPNLKLPEINTYADYNEALKIQQYFSYKLGQALIKAYKNWYKGGFIKLIPQIKQLKIEKEKLKNKKDIKFEKMLSLDDEISKFLISKNKLKLDKREIPLIVSFTSYPKRMYQIKYTIYSILNQTIKPDKFILWLTTEEFPNKEKELPEDVLQFREHGLEIRWVEKNYICYNSYYYAKKFFPNSILVICNDDVFYPNFWLERLYNAYKENPKMIHCHRAHKITFDKGQILPYKKWNWSISYERTEPSFLNFPTSVGGILYPPYIFSYDDMIDLEKCYSDDMHNWAMAILNNIKINVIKYNHSHLLSFNDEKKTGALHFKAVEQGYNDVMLNNILKKYPKIQYMLSGLS